MFVRPNRKSVFALPPVNVTFHAYHNIYVYSAMKLWIAYGIAIFVALILSSLGLFAIVVNGASYSNNFSSALRFARGAFVSKETNDEDPVGRDTLPVYLSTARVNFDRQRNLRSLEKIRSASGSSSLL